MLRRLRDRPERWLPRSARRVAIATRCTDWLALVCTSTRVSRMVEHAIYGWLITVATSDGHPPQVYNVAIQQWPFGTDCPFAAPHKFVGFRW